MPINVDLSSKDSGDSAHRLSVLFTWLSGSGKYILLITNIFLFTLYLSRFYIDRKNVLLTREIQELHSKITSNENEALEYGKLQNVALFMNQQNATAVDTSFILNTLNLITPSGIIIKNLSANGTILVIQALSPDPSVFSRFMDFFLKEPRFKQVLLESSVYNEQEGTFLFVLKVEISNEL